MTAPPGANAFDEADEADEREHTRATEVPPSVAPTPWTADEERISRISLRLPEHLEVHIEEAARRERRSADARLVRALGAAVDPGGDHDRRPVRRAVAGGERVNGWGR